MAEHNDTESIWEIRRRASGHFWGKAQNAHRCAGILFKAQESITDIACYEGFLRESSIALELILKALIAEQSNRAPPSSHDVYLLWQKANLSALENDDLMRLSEITETLYWRGRYGAPNKDSDLKKAAERSSKHQRRKKFGKTFIISELPYGWNEFDRLYQIVLAQYHEIHAAKRNTV